MTKLNLSKNGIKGAEAGKALGDAIAGNTVLKELDISGDKYNKCDVEFVKAFAVGLHDNGALLSLDISRNNLRVEGTKLLAKAIESNQTMTSLSISSNDVTYNGSHSGDMSGVAALADVLPGMGALTTLDISTNKLTRGALKAGENGLYNAHYETDMTGMTTLLGVVISTHCRLYLQALPPLPVPSRIWGHYWCCLCKAMTSKLLVARR
jgi:hypothetical protein